MVNSWKQYERDVVSALKRIDPQAQVEWNKKVPDVRTGSLRQVDAWIQVVVCSHPVKIVGSCKRLARRVNASDIDHLLGEMKAVGAHTGMIFSKVGFASTAIKAAKAEGISCCLLVEGHHIQFKSPLAFRTFLIWPGFAFTILGSSIKSIGGTYGPLLLQAMGSADSDDRLIDRLIRDADKVFEELLKERGDWLNGKLSPGYRSLFQKFNNIEKGHEIVVEVLAQIRLFESRQEAITVDGVVNVSESKFYGNIRGPFIDTQGSHPGSGWTELFEAPASIRPAICCVVFYLKLEAEKLLELLAPRILFDETKIAASERRLKEAAPIVVPDQRPRDANQKP